MLLKPATPLTILLLIAFVLLLLSVLSTPIIKGIPLATFENVDYGVFGYCKGPTCTNIHIGYSTSDLDQSADDFNLPSSTRRSLSAILIVHPVAAFLTLVCLCLAAAAHFHGPSHSPRYLLGLLILLLPTLLVSLLAFLVDILLFVPHMGWGGWIVLAATIILVSCGVVTCAMRRTLVSRKARKRRIAENAEMSGENYYNRQNAAAAAAGLNGARAEALGADTKEPILSNSPHSDSGPTFAAFRTTTRESDDDRTPLNSHTPPNDIPNVPPPDGRYTPRTRALQNGPPDETGNPLPPRGPYGPGPGMRPDGFDPRLRNQYSDGSMGSRRGAPQGFGPRGRGGYPPRGGYGRGGPYGGPRGPAPNGRGGPMGPMRGGPPMMMGRGQRGPPAGYAPGPGGPNRSFDSYGSGPGPRPGPPGYGPSVNGYENQGPSPVGPMRRPSNGPVGLEPTPDAGPIGQAIEMQPQPRPPAINTADADLHLQPHALSVDGVPQPLESPTSVYSRQESYVPPRTGWGNGTSPSPIDEYGSPTGNSVPRRTRSPSGSNYYEDVDPRFDNPEPVSSNARLPSALVPGPAGEPKPTESFEDLPDGARSPAASETSHFTSISERPVNPRWRPPMPRAQQRTQVLLENNPDFELGPAAARGGTVGMGGRMPPLPIPREQSRYPLP